MNNSGINSSLLESPRFLMKTSFETGHDDMVNDAKMDFFGSTLATASSDKTVRIFSIDHKTGCYRKLAELTGFNGPVWQVSWSHPSVGCFLASVSYDGRIIIWKDASEGTAAAKQSLWKAVFDEIIHNSSVNTAAWAAPKFGSLLAAGSSDGSISILLQGIDDETWTIVKKIKAHELGCQVISWSSSDKCFASGGNDSTVKIWSQQGEEWLLENTLEGHADWISALEWCPSSDILVAASRNGKVILWNRIVETEKQEWNHSSSFIRINMSQSDMEQQPLNQWESQLMHFFESGSNIDVSWDSVGVFLYVARNDNEVFVWKEVPGGLWKCVTKGDPNTSVILAERCAIAKSKRN